MKKAYKRTLLISLPLLIIIAALIVLNTLAPIITGYAAKNLASGIFVAGRTQESMENEDLSFSFIRFNNNTVDMEKKEVTSRFLFWKSKAVYTDCFGCTLVRDFTEEDIRSRTYSISSLPDIDADTVVWPAGNVLADTIPAGINMQRLNNFLDTVFADSLPLKGTFAVAVAYKNQLVAERYREDFSPDNLFLSWSVAKSFTNTLVGILAAQGKMDINQSALFPEWHNDERSNITLTHLLQMNSGLQWNEDYGNNSDVNKMLFKNGDMAAYAINQQLEATPGTLWYYSSGTTNIVCRLIRNTIGNDAEYYAFPQRELFNRIGMYSAVFETDASGDFTGSSYLYATMRDYVRYGLLYLKNGNWLGEQIIPESWVDFSVTPAQGSNGRYGAFFWLNRNGEYPEVPADMYSCNGHDGQYIFIIPSKDLVIVRTGFSQNDVFDPYVFLKGILETIDN